MMRVELTDGAWADLRDKISNGQRKRFLKSIAERNKRVVDYEGNPVGTLTQSDLMESALGASEDAIILCVEKWSIATEPPAENPEALDELDVEMFDELAKACSDHMATVFPDFAKAKAGESEADSPS